MFVICIDDLTIRNRKYNANFMSTNKLIQFSVNQIMNNEVSVTEKR